MAFGKIAGRFFFRHRGVRNSAFWPYPVHGGSNGFPTAEGRAAPQLEGKRAGRPKGSTNYADAWADVRWAYDHRYDDRATPPSRNALLWRGFAAAYPDELEQWLSDCGKL